MDRRITGFHKDSEQHWVADLECGHEVSVRHDPPWESTRWVLTARGRSDRIGTRLVCRACDFRLRPEDQVRLKATLEGLLEWHRTATPEELAELEAGNAWCATSRFPESHRPAYDPWTGPGLQVLLNRAIAAAIASRDLAPEVHGELVVHVTTSTDRRFTATIAASPAVPAAVHAIATRAFATVTAAPAAMSEALHVLQY